MGFVKRKGSNAGKVTVAHFEEVKEVFLADISAEVLMNDINPELIFNWDQTAIHYVSTGQWTMHQSGEKIVPIAHSDDKRQITAVLAVTMMGKYFPPQLIYQGKTNRCHPVMIFPQEWDICHTESHWSTEESMKRYISNIILPFVAKLREDLQLNSDSPALALFDCFSGQTTPDILAMLNKNNIRVVQIPSRCTDKLQPIDISLNKPLKDTLRCAFRTWYAKKVEDQLSSGITIDQVLIDMLSSLVKNQSANWLISAWSELTNRPDVAVNGFKKAGIYDAVNQVQL